MLRFGGLRAHVCALEVLLPTLCLLLVAVEAHSAINVSIVTTRQQCDDPGDVCPAPQALFFDATGTTCTAGECADSYRELDYTWNFGDPGSGNWVTGASQGSRNDDHGPISFHVYESPGVYTAQLTVTDGSNTVTHPMTIHIDDPNAHFASTTHCYSRTGDFTGCPVCSDSSHPDCSISSGSFASEVNASLAAGDRRILFRAGDTYSSGTISANVSGPIQIATFGLGGVGQGRVTVNMGGSAQVIDGPHSTAIERWTVWNFDFVWNGSTGGHGIIIGNGPNFETCWNDFLSFQNSGTNTVNFNGTLSCDVGVNPDGMSQDVFFVNNGQMINGVGVDNERCNYFGVQRGVMAGMRFGSSCERDMRVETGAGTGTLGPLVISHNTYPSTRFKTESSIAFRGGPGDPDAGAGGARYVLISDSLFPTAGTSHITFTSCCETGPNAKRTADVIVERNQMLAAIGYGWLTNHSARRLTVRNNVVRASGAGKFYNGGANGCATCDPSWPRDNHILNNSIYSTVSVTPILFHTATDANGVCRSNLYYSTAGDGTDTCSGAAVDSENASRNALDSVTLAVNPFVATPGVPGPLSGWELNTTSGGGLRAIDAAQPIQEVLRDLLGRARPNGSAHDIGAMETGAGGSATLQAPFLLSD